MLKSGHPASQDALISELWQSGALPLLVKALAVGPQHVYLAIQLLGALVRPVSIQEISPGTVASTAVFVYDACGRCRQCQRGRRTQPGPGRPDDTLLYELLMGHLADEQLDLTQVVQQGAELMVLLWKSDSQRPSFLTVMTCLMVHRLLQHVLQGRLKQTPTASASATVPAEQGLRIHNLLSKDVRGDVLDYVPFDVLVVKDETNLVGKAIVALYALPIPAGPHGLWASSYAQRAESLLLNEHLRNSKDLRLWDCALVLRAYHEEAATDPDAKHSHVTNKGPCSSFDLTASLGFGKSLQQCLATVHKLSIDGVWQAAVLRCDLPLLSTLAPLAAQGVNEAMKDPVIAGNGHTYERTAMKEWLSQGQPHHVSLHHPAPPGLMLALRPTSSSTLPLPTREDNLVKLCYDE
ncbi:hypothetical protein ABBQ32_013194 [Trebouxia sp. C0010 RCD-2024]